MTKIVKYSSIYKEGEYCLTAIVVEFNIDGDKLSMELKSKENLVATYYFKTNTQKEDITSQIEYGTKIEACGELKVPLNNTIPNTFNYKKYLYNNKIYFTLSIKEISKIENKKDFYDIKNLMRKKVTLRDKNGYLQAFILGDMKRLDADMFSNYQVNGITHLFAISGMHISLIAVLFLNIFKKIKIKESIRYILVIGILFVFAFLTGNTASVERAIVFFVLLSLNKYFYTHIDTLCLLVLTAGVMIVIKPFIIYDIGFLYSILVTFGIIYHSDFINKGSYLTKLFKVSLIAFLYSAPISWNNFYELNFLSIINNIIFVPLITFVVYPLSVIATIFPFKIFDYSIVILEMINKFFADIKILNIVLQKPQFITILLFYLILVISKYKRKVIISLLVLVTIARIKPYFDNSAQIYYLDVGQGDSALIIYPNFKQIVMIDTGGSINYEKKEWQRRNKEYKISDNVIRFLKSLGISKIDLLILSHGDADHLGEFDNIYNSIKIDKIWFNMGEYNSSEKHILKRTSNNIQLSNYQNIINLNNGGYDNENDNSQVTKINIYGKTFLFLGDVSKRVEESIFKQEENIDFIKLAHHGSKTSSSYNVLKLLDPKIAIISSGRNNRYSHPSNETINTLEDLQINYLNTQTSGTIAIKIRRKTYTITEYKP